MVLPSMRGALREVACSDPLELDPLGTRRAGFFDGISRELEEYLTRERALRRKQWLELSFQLAHALSRPGYPTGRSALREVDRQRSAHSEVSRPRRWIVARGRSVRMFCPGKRSNPVSRTGSLVLRPSALAMLRM